jgi:hypothetical protein
MHGKLTPVIKDAFGQDLAVGDWVTYPGRQSSNMYIRIAQIIDIIDEEKTDWLDRKYMARRVKVIAFIKQWVIDGYIWRRKNVTIRVVENLVKTFPLVEANLPT